MDHISGVFESLAVPFQNIAGGLNDIFNSIKSILNYLNPIHENFFLKVALVPSEGYFNMYWNEIYNNFNAKLPIIAQIKEFLVEVRYVSYSENIPEFEVTFNNKYGQGTYEIIDFSYFAEYRNYILNFIRFIAWFYYLKRLYKKLPSIVY